MALSLVTSNFTGYESSSGSSSGSASVLGSSNLLSFSSGDASDGSASQSFADPGAYAAPVDQASFSPAAAQTIPQMDPAAFSPPAQAPSTFDFTG